MRAIFVHGLLRIAVSVVFAIAAFAIHQTAQAQTAVASGSCFQWINPQTGAPYPPNNLVPVGTDPFQYHSDPNHAHIPSGPTVPGSDWVRDPSGNWINPQTGTPYPPNNLVPVGTDPFQYHSDPNHAHIPSGPTVPGSDWVRVPCPPPATQGASNWSGGYLGGELAKNWGHVKTTETLATTDVITNQFQDSGDPIGGGVNAGWLWQLPSGIVVGPVFDAYFPNATVSHPFAGGTFLRSTVDFTATFQARAGYLATPDLLLYAQTGLAVGTQTLKINFGGPISSKSDTTLGPTIGAGAEWRLFDGPTGLLGQSPSLFVEYTHIWWDDANFNTPSASPGFNYAWSRESDEVKAGFRIRF